MKDESRFPQTVEVAVGVDRFDFVPLAESEADLGLLAGVQLLALITLFGVEGDPLDIVLRQHRMLHGADLHMDDAVFNAYKYNTLLPCLFLLPCVKFIIQLSPLSFSMNLRIP